MEQVRIYTAVNIVTSVISISVILQELLQRWPLPYVFIKCSLIKDTKNFVFKQSFRFKLFFFILWTISTGGLPLFMEKILTSLKGHEVW